MLDAINLTCTRGRRTLFHDVSFRLNAAELLQVTGENGSGKSSLLRILCGVGLPDSGEVCWRGQPIRTLRETWSSEVVYLGHANALKDDLSALENLQVACLLAGRPVTPRAAQGALESLGLAACLHLPVRALSQGQKRRSALARLALSGDAPLWILDEPFAALDVGAVQTIEQRIVEHLAGGGSVILTTHQDSAIGARVTRRVDLDRQTEAAC